MTENSLVHGTHKYTTELAAALSTECTEFLEHLRALSTLP